MEMTSYKSGTPSWVDLGSPDHVASGKFYSALFGWDIPTPNPETGNYSSATIRGKEVAGIGEQQAPGVPFWTTYITVDDPDLTAKKVTEAGGQVLVEPFDVMEYGRMAVCTDPAGAQFSVWQARGSIGAQLVNEPGALSWNELTTAKTDEAIAFYSSVLGWGHVTHQMGDNQYTEWTIEGRSIGGMFHATPDMAQMPSQWLTYFAVADADASVAKLQELGGTVYRPPTDIPQGRFAVVADPHGAMFAMIRIAGS